MNGPNDDRPAEILQRLIRFDTTNPPGNERDCVKYIAGLLDSVGLETAEYAALEERPNLVARLPGRGNAPPLMMYGHADVVTAAHQAWTHPPFAGRIVDGYVWGRGALDMKGSVAMMIASVLCAAARGVAPAGDVLLAVLADEEAGGIRGARYLVEEHPEVFAGVRYAIGEFGGFPVRVGGETFYLIQVGEKQPCWLEAKITGPAGHGARPTRDGAMADLGRLLLRLNRLRLPIHITPIVRKMIESMAAALPPMKGFVLRRLLNPLWTDRILARLGETGRNLEPLFRNTVNATLVRGGDKPNVIPSEIAVGLDARLLPGFTLDDLLDELRPILGKEIEVNVGLYDRGSTDPDFGLLDLLDELLRRADPGAIPVPYLLPGSSDARFFSRLGIQTYGFTPMNLPEGFNFFETIHAADERIPIAAVEFGTDVLFRLIERYGESTTDIPGGATGSSPAARRPPC
jgi:acetylornithine deacetylase/succinyl-diaminopimelate desuccinylase-like protein